WRPPVGRYAIKSGGKRLSRQLSAGLGAVAEPRGRTLAPVTPIPDDPSQSGRQQHQRRWLGDCRRGTVHSDRERIEELGRVGPGNRTESACELNDAVAFPAADRIAGYRDRSAAELTVRAACLERRGFVEGERGRNAAAKTPDRKQRIRH